MSKKDDILKLRLKGHSLNFIASKLDHPKSTVAYYCRGTPIAIKKNSRELAKKASIVNQEKWSKIREEITQNAESRWDVIKLDNDFMAFMGIYWGEGYKTQRSTAGVKNNDSLLIKFCYDMFIKIWPDCNLRVRVECYPSHNLKRCENYWKKLLPNSHIQVTKLEPKSNMKPCDRCLYGACSLKVHNMNIAISIMTWLKIWRNSIKRGSVSIL